MAEIMAGMSSGSPSGSVQTLKLGEIETRGTLSAKLVTQCLATLSTCEEAATVVVLEGTEQVFNLGADLEESSGVRESGSFPVPHVYDLLLKLTEGPYITVAHVRGRANAAGVALAAACDIVICDDHAQFSLSELLLGLYPACVLPFLIPRIGVQRAHYMTLSTVPIDATAAASWGLVDAHGPDSIDLLKRHLLRLRRLSKKSIVQYKSHSKQWRGLPRASRDAALSANRQMFLDSATAVRRYAQSGHFPWET